MLDHYKMFADYNRWANRLVYEAAGKLDDAQYRENKGAFFGSLHATLNHVLSADRIWMKRFTGSGEAPKTLDGILFDNFTALSAARAAEDDRIVAFIAGLSEDALAGRFTYTPVSTPAPVTQRLAPPLAHFFNHHTHHRGQCHMTLTALGAPSLGLDMSYFLRTPEFRHYAD
ncbi:DinB family protein [Rhizobium sp. LjRoot98]|uniref:DinB family protein n=1 Tax=unclassified Rhizobium TaxID=2613769 RepID=UPI000715BA5A|nr:MULTISPECIES: DinB family protein [unclassified Rhizobium]KQV37156.1 diguanylate cyclase [Rhizobium sp. Root1204]KQY17167.1 diguanylate cyclase [Rhizobium sp. Root1334]KRC13064.1 diguanylate cyclase [Rhizobium sp. Root73]